ncbi:MAG: hypothetical protein SO415_05410 [Oliverpabstia sp.]|nr:hypothetical protein [Oliverpabstia sp.]
MTTKTREGNMFPETYQSGRPRKMWTLKNYVIHMYEYWLDGMYKLKSIEEYYEIQFKLQYVK